MNLYKYHSAPESLRNHDNAHNTVPDLIIDLARNGHKLNSTQIKAIASTPKSAYEYAKEVIKGRWPEGEKAIASDPWYAYEYANGVIKDIFPKGEMVIASKPYFAFWYARSIIKGRWPEGEKAIASDPWYSKLYNEMFGVTL